MTPGEFSDAEDPLGWDGEGWDEFTNESEVRSAGTRFVRRTNARPVLLLTRHAVIEQLGEIIAAPVTRTIRGLAVDLDDLASRLHGSTIVPMQLPDGHGP